ncbi:hypothetical protein CF15_05635 [Pyrodictium occultum]|uniref:Uncharacterized protein n=1 Tax=Pyrodictium occultum TaxID=2309 RepID=A0A0V8RW99_PYROC|nr:hypothetical protein CF15_05635 [Pyrodictium occultum]
MEKRIQKFKLSLAKILLGFAAGLLAAVLPSGCLASLALYTALLLAVSGYAERRLRLLEGLEPYTTGLVSGLAAYLLGVFFASALAS